MIAVSATNAYVAEAETFAAGAQNLSWILEIGLKGGSSQLVTVRDVVDHMALAAGGWLVWSSDLGNCAMGYDDLQAYNLVSGNEDDEGAMCQETIGGLAAGGGRVVYARTDGVPPTTGRLFEWVEAASDAELVSTVTVPVLGAVAVAGNSVYVVGGTGNDSRLYTINQIGELTEVVSEPVHTVTASGDGVSWATRAGDVVSTVGNDFGSKVVHADGFTNVHSILRHGDHVYWSSPADGTIHRAPKSGVGSETLASGQDQPTALAIAEASNGVTYLYWVNVAPDLGGLMRLPLDP